MFTLNHLPLPTDCQSRLATTVESLRLADQLIDAMLTAPEDASDSNIDDHILGFLQASVVLNARVLQEYHGELPHVPDRLFDAIRSHTNSDHRAKPGIEAAALALTLACTSMEQFQQLHPGNERDDLYDAVTGILWAINAARDILDNDCAFEAAFFIEAYTAGRQVVVKSPRRYVLA